MAVLRSMPPVTLAVSDLLRFGNRWQANEMRLTRTPPESSGQLGELLNEAVAASLATMLGGLPVVRAAKGSLVPQLADCVEQGEVLISGGIRPQQFDVVYRPDGVRFALDSKTLNDTDSVRKNYQNMLNDLAAEATTVHTRFPHAIVAFVVVVPAPCLTGSQAVALPDRLEVLGRREEVSDPEYLAEVISLVVWDPYSGGIDAACPQVESPLRIEYFSRRVEELYRSRYKGLPPHV